MEVTQRLQPVQDEACQLFEEIEGRGVELEQVVIAVEQCLEEPMKEAFIQEFTEQEALAKLQVKKLEPGSRILRQSYPDQSDLGWS
jgi:hypothetical protein